jgi:hypothetical protein
MKQNKEKEEKAAGETIPAQARSSPRPKIVQYRTGTNFPALSR